MEGKGADSNFILVEDPKSSLNDADNNYCRVLSNSLMSSGNNKYIDLRAMPSERCRRNWPKTVLLTMRKRKDGCDVERIDIYQDNNITSSPESFTTREQNSKDVTDKDQHVVYVEENNENTVEYLTNIRFHGLSQENSYIAKSTTRCENLIQRNTAAIAIANENTILEQRLHKRTLPNILKSRAGRGPKTLTSKICDSHSVVFNQVLLRDRSSKDIPIKKLEHNYERRTVHKRKQVYNVREESPELLPSLDTKNKKVQNEDEPLTIVNVRKINTKSAGRKTTAYNAQNRRRKLCESTITENVEDETLAYETLMPELNEATDITCDSTDLTFNMENKEDTLYEKNLKFCNVQTSEHSLDSLIELPQSMDERIDDYIFSTLQDVNNNSAWCSQETSSSRSLCNTFQEYVSRNVCSAGMETWDNDVSLCGKEELGCSFLSNSSCKYCIGDVTTCYNESSTFMEDSKFDISNNIDNMSYKPLEIVDTYDIPFSTDFTEKYFNKDFKLESPIHSDGIKHTNSKKFDTDIYNTSELEKETQQDSNFSHTTTENNEEGNTYSVSTVDIFLEDRNQNLTAPSSMNKSLRDNNYIEDDSTREQVDSTNRIADNIEEVIQNKINDDSTLTSSESGFELSKVDKIQNENEVDNCILEVQEEEASEEDNQTETRELQCILCSLTFSNEYMMTMHQAEAHRGTYIILCEQCGQIFNNTHSFDRHLVYCLYFQVPFECNMCDKKYRHKSSLTFHLRNAHNIEMLDLQKKMI
ncbi:hypothetical protein KM043_002495 [Ampulex compressa]|nr:hypothetical protein KM043_002495 [Ampulex compressa]